MRRLHAIFRAMRVPEGIPFCGVALLGGLMGCAEGSHLPPWDLAFAVAGVFFLTAFTFSFNDLQDMEHDRRSGSKSTRPLVNGSLSVRMAWILTLLTAVTGLSLLAVGTSWAALCVGLMAILLGVAYSWRTLSLKTIPVVSSILHLAYGTAMFVLGAWAVAPADLASVATGAYFGLVFAAGHLNHEVVDLEADRYCGVKTHAVRFGGGPLLYASFALWCLSSAHFCVLALLGVVAAPLGWIQLAMFACYLIGFFAILRGSHDPERLKRLQKLYRGAYLVGGVLMAVALLLNQ